MQDSNNNNRNYQDNSEIEGVKYQQVRANNGALWLVQAFFLFKYSLRSWFGITIFMLVMLSLPIIQNIFALFMPIAVGGLMIGCHQIAARKSIKFEHLFAGLKSDGKELLILSMIYTLGSLAVVILSNYVLLLLDISITGILPVNAEDMTNAQLIEWFNTQGPEKMMPLLQSMGTTLILMIPLFMAYWFAPALIVLRNKTAIAAMKLSFRACKDNIFPFIIYVLTVSGFLMLFLLVVSVLAHILPILAIILILPGLFSLFAISIVSLYTSYINIFEQPDKAASAENIHKSGSSMLA